MQSSQRFRGVLIRPQVDPYCHSCLSPVRLMLAPETMHMAFLQASASSFSCRIGIGQMTGIVKRNQDVIPGVELEHIDGAGFLPDAPETVISQSQHT